MDWEFVNLCGEQLNVFWHDLKSVHCPQIVISRISFKVSKVLALNLNSKLWIGNSWIYVVHLGTYFDDLKSVHCPQKVISRLSFKVSKVLALNSLFAKVARGKNAFLHVRFREIFFANCHARAHAHWVQRVCTAK